MGTEYTRSLFKMRRNIFCKFSHLAALLLIGSVRQGLTIEWNDAKKDALTFCMKNATLMDDTLYGEKVCATDAKTYPTMAILMCVNKHARADEATVHEGPCEEDEQYCDMNLHYVPVCGSDNQTYPNAEILECHRRNGRSDLKRTKNSKCSPDVDPCYRNILKFGLQPVCASNGYTYDNPEQVKCLRQDNRGTLDLKIVGHGGCRVDKVYEAKGAGELPCQIMKHRYEWNPVCADGDRTYVNPFWFLCDPSKPRVKINDECHTDSANACLKAHLNTIVVGTKIINEDFCSADRVCGNDGITYRSKYHLQCQSLRNPFLSFSHEGACAGPDDNPCGDVSLDLADVRPVCGTNGVTYFSAQALFCARRRLEQIIEFLHMGECLT